MTNTNQTRRTFLQSSLAGLLALSTPNGNAERKPNIVLIMADDLGYGDIGCYGNDWINTPHLDALARNGMRFTDYHSNAPVCSPTRAALLTGRYQQRSGLEGVIYVRGETRQVGLRQDEVTFAEVLKKAGYKTGIFGKWHLGYKKEYNPVHHGFDVFHGYVSGNIDYHSHYDNAGIADWWHNLEQIEEEGYVTDLITDHAIDFIKSNKDNPFCVYIAHEAPHWPYQGREDKADRFPGVDFNSHGSRKDKKGAYKEMVEAMDENIGRVIKTLEQLGLSRDTFVFFCSDNGATPLGSNGSLRGDKGSLWEGGHRVPAIAYWPGKIDKGQTIDDTVLSMDMFPTMASLAGASDIDTPPLDGVDISPLLVKNKSLPERTLFWRYRRHKVVRQGQWKWIAEGKNQYLFNLETDRNEQNNLANTHKEKARELAKAMARWEQSISDVKLITD